MDQRILIVYYSYSGNTRRLAKSIQKRVGGKLYELFPSQPYSEQYNQLMERVKQEFREKSLPEIKGDPENLEDCHMVYVGTPNWCGKIAPPVVTFLREHDFSGKIIIPFCTHGGGGSGNIKTEMEVLCPGARVCPGLAVCGGLNPDFMITNWIQKNESVLIM